MNEVFISGYVEIIFLQFHQKFTARCIYFVLILTKTGGVILDHDLFLLNSGPDSTADRPKRAG